MNPEHIKIVYRTLAEFAKDAEKEIVDCQTIADTGRGVSRTELDRVPAVFEELAHLEDTHPYGLGNNWNWKLDGLTAVREIAAHRVAASSPGMEYEEARKIVEEASALPIVFGDLESEASK